MSALLKQYFNIAFLMGRPQDLPSGESQMVIGIALNFITYIIALTAIDSSGNPVMHAIVDIGLTGLFLFIGLSVFSKRPRFEQAYGGLCGAGAILNVSAVLLLYPSVSGGSPGTLAQVGYFVLLVWSLSLSAHVLRHAFEILMPISIAIALVYYIFISSLMLALWPSEDPRTADVSNYKQPVMEPTIQPSADVYT